MLKMKISRVDRDNDNTPVLYDREIDEYALAVLKDYRPALLKEPGIVNYENFIESYLGAALMYKDIYNEDPQRPIFAVTIFRDSTFKLFDRENDCISNSIFRANTILIDNYVIQKGKEGFALFTGLHEAGHFLLHRSVYSVYKAGLICSRRENSDVSTQSNNKRSADKWRERQADYFAASLAMPNTTFIPFVNSYLREHGIFKRNITLGHDDDTDLLIRDLLPEHIAMAYGVSKQAAFIKLKTNKFIVNSL